MSSSWGNCSRTITTSSWPTVHRPRVVKHQHRRRTQQSTVHYTHIELQLSHTYTPRQHGGLSRSSVILTQTMHVINTAAVGCSTLHGIQLPSQPQCITTRTQLLYQTASVRLRSIISDAWPLHHQSCHTKEWTCSGPDRQMTDRLNAPCGGGG